MHAWCCVCVILLSRVGVTLRARLLVVIMNGAWSCVCVSCCFSGEYVYVLCHKNVIQRIWYRQYMYACMLARICVVLCNVVQASAANVIARVGT